MPKNVPKPLEKWQAEDAARLTSLCKKLLKGETQAQFGLRTGIGNQSMVSQYQRGERALNIEAARKFADGLGVLIDEFSPTLAKQIAKASERIEQETPASDHAPVRLLDARASAGNGSLVFSEDTDRVLMFRRDWLARHDAKPDDVLAFPVRGASMVDMHIVDGSVVLVNQGKKEPVSKKVYVLWIDGKLYVKQLVKHNGQWIARSHNSAEAAKFPDIPIEIDARIVGRAFWCGFSL